MKRFSFDELAFQKKLARKDGTALSHYSEAYQRAKKVFSIMYPDFSRKEELIEDPEFFHKYAFKLTKTWTSFVDYLFSEGIVGINFEPIDPIYNKFVTSWQDFSEKDIYEKVEVATIREWKQYAENDCDGIVEEEISSEQEN